MTSTSTIVSLAAILAMVLALPAAAQTRDATTPNEPSLQQGSTVNNKANGNGRSPGTGITKDLAPDTKQLATGGPVGGSGSGSPAGGN